MYKRQLGNRTLASSHSGVLNNPDPILGARVGLTVVAISRHRHPLAYYHLANREQLIPELTRDEVAVGGLEEGTPLVEIDGVDG